MQEFITSHPGVVVSVGGVGLTVAGWSFLKIWGLMRENQRLKDEGYKREGSLLASAIDDLKATMHTALDRLTATIDRVDERHNEIVNDIYERIGATERKLEKLVGEHGTRAKTCPGKMLLDQWLSEGRLDRREHS